MFEPGDIVLIKQFPDLPWIVSRRDGANWRCVTLQPVGENKSRYTSRLVGEGDMTLTHRPVFEPGMTLRYPLAADQLATVVRDNDDGTVRITYQRPKSGFDMGDGTANVSKASLVYEDLGALAKNDRNSTIKYDSPFAAQVRQVFGSQIMTELEQE